MVAERSESGRWERGERFTLPLGPCKGHEIEVVNPEVELWIRKFTVSDRGMISMSKELVQEKAVVSRCQECWRSIMFPEWLEAGDE